MVSQPWSLREEGLGGRRWLWGVCRGCTSALNLPPKKVNELFTASQYLLRRLQDLGVGEGSSKRLTIELGLVVIWKLVSHYAARVGRKVQERYG